MQWFHSNICHETIKKKHTHASYSTLPHLFSVEIESSQTLWMKHPSLISSSQPTLLHSTQYNTFYSSSSLLIQNLKKKAMQKLWWRLSSELRSFSLAETRYFRGTHRAYEQLLYLKINAQSSWEIWTSCCRLQDVTSQKTAFFIVSAVTISNLTRTNFTLPWILLFQSYLNMIPPYLRGKPFSFFGNI